MPLTIMRRIKFCAGHRLHGHGGKCENFHGHNYVADFFVEGDEQDEVGRIIDFSELKRRVKGWIDEHWDHSFLVHEDDENARTALSMVKPCRLFVMPYNPTAENMAKYLLEEMCPEALQGTGGACVPSPNLGNRRIVRRGFDRSYQRRNENLRRDGRQRVIAGVLIAKSSRTAKAASGRGRSLRAHRRR